jgi:hypothetical protein
MAYIHDVPESEVPRALQVPDPDHIIQIHRVHPEVMRQHFELYRELMHRPGPLTRFQRELLAVRISAINHCHY